jgi:hypothetical protein
MQHPGSSTAGGPARRLVLGGAFAIGLALAPHPDAVLAADKAPALVVAQGDAATLARGKAAQQADGKIVPSTGETAVPAPPKRPEGSSAATPDTATPDAADESDGEVDTARKSRVTVDHHGIVIEKGSKRVRIQGLGRDREYDSFEQFVQDAPWLAGLVFLTVLFVFLVPLLIIVLLIWYKIRKNRMANETMLKLAERGVVPPTAAMDAVASGHAAPVAEAAASTPPGVPAYEHARALHRRAIWSDLRKGVILSGIGLGLSAYSMFDDGRPNGIGLIFLFVGLGYCLLWYFEDRPRGNTPASPPPGGA